MTVIWLLYMYRVFLALLREAHFFDVIQPAVGALTSTPSVGRHAFVADVQLGQLAARVAECPEVAHVFHKGQARQHFFQVVGEGGAVFGAVQKAVHVVKYILFRHPVAVAVLRLFQDVVAYAVAAHVFRRFGGVKHGGVLLGAFFVVVEGKALSFLQ